MRCLLMLTALLFLAAPLRADHDGLWYDPVTVDEVCAAGDPGGAAPLCDALADANAGIRAGCEAQGGDPGLCAVPGGNVHGLVQSCYHQGVPQFGNDARRMCKVADTFVSAAASYCRQVPGMLPEFCALMSSDLVSATQIARYQESDVHVAHALQRELSAGQPMRHTLYIATHNSYNYTDANTPPTLSGSDANQRYSVVDQLRMDIRGLELDVHWMPSASDGKFRATVCHGNAEHAGCTWERSLREELAELRIWLDENPGEVIVIDLESHLEDTADRNFSPKRYAETSAEIFAALGERLFLPGMSQEGRTAPACEAGQPIDFSIQDLRALGRQVILYSRCGGYIHEGQELVFGRDPTHEQSGAGSYAGMQAPDDCRFSPAALDGKWVRFYEDGTFVGAATGVAAPATLEEVREMARCNINMPSLDHVQPFDGRLEALLWSFDPEALPASVTGRRQLVHDARGRFVTAPAKGAGMTALACRRTGGSLLAGDGLNPSLWVVGDRACPPGYRPAVPRNGLENELLKRAKQSVGVESVRLDLCVEPAAPGGGEPAQGKRRTALRLCR